MLLLRCSGFFNSSLRRIARRIYKPESVSDAMAGHLQGSVYSQWYNLGNGTS